LLDTCTCFCYLYHAGRVTAPNHPQRYSLCEIISLLKKCVCHLTTQQLQVFSWLSHILLRLYSSHDLIICRELFKTNALKKLITIVHRFNVMRKCKVMIYLAFTYLCSWLLARGRQEASRSQMESLVRWQSLYRYCQDC